VETFVFRMSEESRGHIVPPQRQPSPGLKLLQRSASEVALEDSIEAEGKFFLEADKLAVERGMPSPARGAHGSPDERDLSTASASSTHTAASIQAALTSSQQLGGQPVEVSLNAKTPQKSPSPNKSASASASASHSATTTPKGNNSKPATPTSVASALSRTTPTPVRHAGGGSNSAQHAALLAEDARGGTPLHHTSPHPYKEKGVTINEDGNTLHSPSAAAMKQGSSSSGAGTNSSPVPTLKPAGANSAGLDDDVNDLVQRARRQAPPRGVAVAEANAAANVQVSEVPQPRVVHSEADLVAKARSRAAYLIKSAENNNTRDSTDNRDRDRYSDISGASRSSFRSSKSQVSECLRKSQEKGWGDKITASIGEAPGGISPAQQALFLSMKRVSTAGKLRSSGESKFGGGGADSDDDGRQSTAGSMRSSRSADGSSVRRSSSAKSKMRIKDPKEAAETLNNLTAPVRHIYTEAEKRKDPSLEFMLLEEAKNCRRKPFKSKGWAESQRPDDDDEAKGSGVGGFVERMDSKERSRRHDMEYKTLKKAYDCRLDKKQCPQCESPQSYDEVVNKRSKCSVCELDFKPRLTWAQVSKQFTNRNKEYTIKSNEIKQKIVQTIEQELKPKHHAFNPQTGKVEEVLAEPKKSRWDGEMEKSFFERMEEKLDLREDRLQRVEDESFGKQCTFRPAIAKKKKVGQDSDGDEDEEEEDLTEEDKAQAFMMRYDADFEERRKAHPEKYRPKWEYVDPKLEGKSQWN